MSRPKEQRCHNCYYCSHTDDEKLFWCNRYPPDDDAVFVERYSWCGEWRPAQPQTVDQAATEMARFVLLGDLSAARGLADLLVEMEGK